jgi:hypothetical protein
MAGNYPDVPGYRMMYDIDGSAGFQVTGATVAQLTSAQLINMNDENAATYNDYGQSAGYVGIIFPQLRDLVAYYWQQDTSYSGAWGGPGALQTSADTTNGLDGTWTTRLANFSYVGSSGGNPVGVVPYRSSIQSLSVTGIKAIRFGYGSTFQSGPRPAMLHLYGSVASGQTPDRLRFWDATLDQEVGGAFFDFADVPRTNTVQKQFRVKNNSASLTATAITLSFSALTDTSPTVVSQLTLSNGGAFSSSLAIGDLAPGAISSVITVRFSPIITATLGVWDQRLKASATTWV